jgi:hypothetical protein
MGAVGLIFLTAVQLAAAEPEARPGDMEKLERMAEALNRSLPAMRGDDLRVEKVVVGPGFSWTLRGTFVNHDYSDALVRSFHANTVPYVTKGMCNLYASSTEFDGRRPVTRFVYADRGGKVVGDVTLTLDSCSNKQLKSP